VTAPTPARDLHIDRDRVVDELNHLATFSSHPAPAVTRVVFTREDQLARAYLDELYREAGLTVRVDAIGNTFARWASAGTDPDAPPVATGSHIDAIPNAGRYDGCVGVLGGLEAIRSLQRAGYQPRRPIELIQFTSEEPTRFAMGCTGSRAMAGVLSPDQLSTLRDDRGDDYDTVRQRAGYSGPLSEIALGDDACHAFVELHIEQGPRLEQADTTIGIVTAIAAPATLTVTYTGAGGHAGAVLMPDRKDAFCGAAEAALALEQLARDTSPDTVATCGLIDVQPGAVNSIPLATRLTLDIRDTNGDRRDGLIQHFQQQATAIADRRGLGVRFELNNADPPAGCAPLVLDAVRDAVAAAGHPAMELVSRAYHDALFMAQLTPTGMIFIPCRGGVSHRPDEFAEPDHIAAGVEVLAHTLARLAS